MPADVHDKKTRSRNMAAIRSLDTKPELLIRKSLHARGYRYRLHNRQLPGKPDIVLPKYNAVIFVHGCFWHGHGCHLFKWPQTRAEFWRTKISKNAENDVANCAALLEAGWRVGKVWECCLTGRWKLPYDDVTELITDWLTSGRLSVEILGRPLPFVTQGPEVSR